MATTKRNSPKTGDARLGRTNLSEDSSRAPRSATADEPRTNLDGTGLSKAERMRMIKDEFKQEALPNVPAIPGWHTCWLSSTSTYDPLSKRERLGYVPVEPAELRGFKVERTTTASDGLVRCNEMILYKIELDIYEAIMQEFHHDQPMREEEALKAQLKGQGHRDSDGRELGEIEGFEDLAVKRDAPHFA